MRSEEWKCKKIEKVAEAEAQSCRVSAEQTAKSGGVIGSHKPGYAFKGLRQWTYLSWLTPLKDKADY
jgi:hypothetical protein